METKLDFKTILRYGLILFAIAAVCTALLALTNMVTEPEIAIRDEEKNTQAQQSVLPDADKFDEVKDLDQVKQIVDQDGADGAIIDSVDKAYKGDQLVGYTVKTLPSGYGGEITLLTGIGTDEEITGIYVIEQSETAGLGARSTEQEFQDQFKGKKANEDITVEKNGEVEGNEIEAISGATITSTAIATGVNTSEKAVDAVEELEK